jgi:hypothetical protein
VDRATRIREAVTRTVATLMSIKGDCQIYITDSLVEVEVEEVGIEGLI